MSMTALVTFVWLAVALGTPAVSMQDDWLKGFEGTWVVDAPPPDPGGAEISVRVARDASLSVTITRDASGLLLKTKVNGQEVQTRYGLNGKDVTNKNPFVDGQGIFRTRVDKQKLVTEIWMNSAAGPPQTIETRYLESTDVMVTELSHAAGEPAFNRTVMRRKGTGLFSTGFNR